MRILTTAALSGGPLIPVTNVKSGCPRPPRTRAG